MKISRREFIQLGAAALVAGVLPESKQPTPAEQAYAKALEMMPMEAKEKQLAFIEEVLETGGDVWPTPPEKWGRDIFEVFVSGIRNPSIIRYCDNVSRITSDDIQKRIDEIKNA